MSVFGGESPKPLVLKGTGDFLDVFREAYLLRKSSRTSSTSQRLTVVDKRGHFTGVAGSLTASSSYTRSFGMAMALALSGCTARQIVDRLASMSL